MKFTKLLALIMAIAMVFSFAACSNDAEKTPETDTPSVSDEAPSSEAPKDDAQAELPELKVPQTEIVFKDFTFKVNGQEVKSSDLKDLTIYKVKLDNLLSKDGSPATDKETGEPLVVSYTGYKLVDILKAIGVEGKTVYAVCSDGFESAVYELDADNADYLIVGVEKDKEQAADGTLHFAPAFEQMNGKYAKSVTEFIVE